jgi:hypothetical protein
MGDPAARVELTTRLSGLRYYDEKRGTGESPVFGESVRVHFVASWVRWDQPLTVESHSVHPPLPSIPVNDVRGVSRLPPVPGIGTAAIIVIDKRGTIDTPRFSGVVISKLLQPLPPFPCPLWWPLSRRSGQEDGHAC